MLPPCRISKEVGGGQGAETAKQRLVGSHARHPHSCRAQWAPGVKRAASFKNETCVRGGATATLGGGRPGRGHHRNRNGSRGVAPPRHPPFPTPSPAHAPGTTGAGRTGAATPSCRHPGWKLPACGQSLSPAAPWSPSFPWQQCEGKGKVADLGTPPLPESAAILCDLCMSATDSAGSGGAGAAGAGAPAAAPSASSSVGSSGGGGGSGAAAASSAGFAGRVVPEAFAVRGGRTGRP